MNWKAPASAEAVIRARTGRSRFMFLQGARVGRRALFRALSGRSTDRSISVSDRAPCGREGARAPRGAVGRRRVGSAGAATARPRSAHARRNRVPQERARDAPHRGAAHGEVEEAASGRARPVPRGHSRGGRALRPRRRPGDRRTREPGDAISTTPSTARSPERGVEAPAQAEASSSRLRRDRLDDHVAGADQHVLIGPDLDVPVQHAPGARHGVRRHRRRNRPARAGRPDRVRVRDRDRAERRRRRGTRRCTCTSSCPRAR